MPETPTDIPGFYAVIPAGGSGTRLWPLSRRSSPSFFMTSPAVDVACCKTPCTD
ncbi:sugar phosphate nucleotidyltransferase [Ornithinimicrobium sp. INDO-MA30-4]|uniref:sugar phosphate nucleotidyltransferase n=1 Tax=Ornithinimicrobium sp. INDO-MA30-4 TaxID=2908651 RepID=UPI002882E02A|nr:sugar phosphate nucleotidyltransferase [Ornithinimicrobium sp. INDO-MA30-4]